MSKKEEGQAVLLVLQAWPLIRYLGTMAKKGNYPNADTCIQLQTIRREVRRTQQMRWVNFLMILWITSKPW